MIIVITCISRCTAAISVYSEGIFGISFNRYNLPTTLNNLSFISCRWIDIAIYKNTYTCRGITFSIEVFQRTAFLISECNTLLVNILLEMNPTIAVCINPKRHSIFLKRHMGSPITSYIEQQIGLYIIQEKDFVLIRCWKFTMLTVLCIIRHITCRNTNKIFQTIEGRTITILCLGSLDCSEKQEYSQENGKDGAMLKSIK